MLDGYDALLIPLTTLAISGGFAIWLYYSTRQFWRTALDNSRGARFLFVVFAVIIIPLVLGGWSDIVDVSEILQGNLSAKHAVSLSILSVLLVGYLYLHGCWFDREENNLTTRASELAKVQELNCQKNYLVRLLENFRSCIGEYAGRLRSVLSAPDSDGPVSQRIPVSLASDNIKMIIESVRRTYMAIESVPPDYTVKVLLLEAQDGFLVHNASYDGTNWDCSRNDVESHRRDYFDLKKSTCSAAVACVDKGTIHIIEDCEDCHRDENHPFRFFHDCMPMQREHIGSMVVIPLEPHGGHKFVLCLTCAKPYAFLRNHMWKARAAQENLNARLSLLLSQAEIFGLMTAEITELRHELEDLNCRFAAQGHDLDLNEQRNKEIVDSLAKSKSTQDILSRKLETMSETLGESEEKFAAIRIEYESQKTKAKQLSESNERLKVEMKELKASLEAATTPPLRNIARKINRKDGTDV